jgi:hypothetical protein
MTAPATPNVYQSIANVMNEMEGVGKTQRNKEQGYNFRGIDDVLKVLHPLLAKHGVVIVPDVIDREVEERIAKSGSKGFVTYLHVRYTVYGPAGDSFEASTWGEGLDYGDKSTNKAMTAAFKYLLFEVFAVADPDDDGDHTTPEETETVSRRRAAPTGTGLCSEKQLGMIGGLFTEKGFPNDRDVRHAYANAVIGREVSTSKEMTVAEASKVITALQAEEPFAGDTDE